MVESFYSRASPTCGREREKWRDSNWLAARVGRARGCTPDLPYIGGWAASLDPPPRPRAGGQRGGVGGQVPPFLLEESLRVSPGLAGWAFRGLVRLAQVARTLPFRPMQASVKWAHYGPTPEPSRTLRYNTDKLQNFSVWMAMGLRNPQTRWVPALNEEGLVKNWTRQV
jgi:hypothetical protein